MVLKSTFIFVDIIYEIHIQILFKLYLILNILIIKIVKLASLYTFFSIILF